MAAPRNTPRQRYLEWVEEQIEEHKSRISRDELLQIADQAVRELQPSTDGQYPLTEILLRDAVDSLIFRRLELPSYRRWLRLCRSDTGGRPGRETEGWQTAAEQDA
ncbi:MAG: hypothetical protein HY703_07485 [Gemmatimonadetes bacterium]|nr:hypothetical protein [Gemmatimonadota bacterium]